MAQQDGVLELLDLRRRFGETIALDGLSFAVPPGQVSGFLGPNGAGKTTLRTGGRLKVRQVLRTTA